MASKALVVAAFGARGTGKTGWLLQFYAPAPALAVWDYKHDPRLEGYCDATDSLPEFIRALGAPRVRLRYLVNRSADVPAQFDLFCRACFQRGNLEMLVDELPAVTRAGRPPDAWRECVNIGREYRTRGDARIKRLGVGITAQRPGEVDKALIGNLDLVHCGRLPFENDARAVAGSLGVHWSQLQQLPDLHYIERRADRAQPSRGVLTFGNGATKKTAARKRAP